MILFWTLINILKKYRWEKYQTFSVVLKTCASKLLMLPYGRAIVLLNAGITGINDQ